MYKLIHEHYVVFNRCTFFISAFQVSMQGAKWGNIRSARPFQNASAVIS